VLLTVAFEHLVQVVSLSLLFLAFPVEPGKLFGQCLFLLGVDFSHGIEFASGLHRP
jgi:hypothetical protein